MTFTLQSSPLAGCLFPNPDGRTNRAWDLLWVTIAYGLLSYWLLLRWASPADLLDHYIGAGEPPGWINQMWWYSHALLEIHTNPMQHSHLFHPLYWGTVDSSFVMLIMVPFTHWLGPVAAYNLHLLAAFTFGGTAMFLLARHVLQDAPCAFLAGVIYTFCAHHFAHGWSHLHIYANYWLPVVTLLFIRFVQEPTIRGGLLLGVAYGLSALTSWSLAAMNALFCGFMLLVAPRAIASRRLLVPTLVASGVSILLVAPGVYWLYVLRSYPGGVPNLQESITYSADLFGFITPTKPHPVVGHHLASLYRKFTGNGCEAAVFLGYTAIFLTVWSAILGWRNHAIRRFTILGGIFLVFSLGPVLQIGGKRQFTDADVTVPLPGAIFPYVPILDMMRAPNRMSILVVMSISVVAPAGLAQLRRRRQWSPARHGLAVLSATSLVLVDSWNNLGLTRPPPTPEFYHYIGARPGHEAILEVPAIRSPLERARKIPNAVTCGYYYEFQQTHHRPLFGGYFNRLNGTHGALMAADPVLRALYSGRAPDQSTPTGEAALLHLREQHSIGHVVLHKRWLSDADLQMIKGLLGQDFYEDSSVTTDPLMIYPTSPHSEPPPFPQVSLELGTGWYGPEIWSGEEARWMNESGVMEIETDSTREVTITFEARAVAGNRTLIVEAANQQQSFAITPAWRPFELRLTLGSGANPIRLRVPEGSLRPIDLPHGTRDQRHLAVAMRRLSVATTDAEVYSNAATRD